jgi:hypothetical protein
MSTSSRRSAEPPADPSRSLRQSPVGTLFGKGRTSANAVPGPARESLNEPWRNGGDAYFVRKRFRRASRPEVSKLL